MLFLHSPSFAQSLHYASIPIAIAIDIVVHVKESTLPSTPVGTFLNFTSGLLWWLISCLCLLAPYFAGLR